MNKIRLGGMGYYHPFVYEVDMNTNHKLLIARINDLFSLCDKHCEMKCSDFLDGGELAVIEDEFQIPYGYNTLFFGGYENAERKVLCVFPEWQESEESEVPISVIRFDVPKFRKLTHRDYLGTLMSLGIDRSKTGDILTDDEGAYVFVMSDIAEYVARNVNKIANAGVNTKIVDMADFIPPKPKTTEKMCVCASLRLDAVVAATLNISRGNTEKLISSGYVKLNHREVLDRSKQVGEGDLLSIRNYGRFILKDIGNNTRKGRLHITAGEVRVRRGSIVLRPIDIQNKEFEKKLKGYNCDEVDDFLDVVIQDYELLCKENQTLKDKIGLLTETVERYKQMENTMQKSIDIAKQAAEDAKRNAETEANAIISKAKLNASYLARQIDDEHMKRHQEMLFAERRD